MNKLFATIFGFGNPEILLIFCAIGFWAFVIWSIRDLMYNKDLAVTPKLIWLAIVLFFPVLGTLLYLYYGRTAKHLSNNR